MEKMASRAGRLKERGAVKDNVSPSVLGGSK